MSQQMAMPPREPLRLVLATAVAILARPAAADRAAQEACAQRECFGFVTPCLGVQACASYLLAAQTNGGVLPQLAEVEQEVAALLGPFYDCSDTNCGTRLNEVAPSPSTPQPGAPLPQGGSASACSCDGSSGDHQSRFDRDQCIADYCYAEGEACSQNRGCVLSWRAARSSGDYTVLAGTATTPSAAALIQCVADRCTHQIDAGPTSTSTTTSTTTVNIFHCWATQCTTQNAYCLFQPDCDRRAAELEMAPTVLSVTDQEDLASAPNRSHLAVLRDLLRCSDSACGTGYFSPVASEATINATPPQGGSVAPNTSRLFWCGDGCIFTRDEIIECGAVECYNEGLACFDDPDCYAMLSLMQDATEPIVGLRTMLDQDPTLNGVIHCQDTRCGTRYQAYANSDGSTCRPELFMPEPPVQEVIVELFPFQACEDLRDTVIANGVGNGIAQYFNSSASSDVLQMCRCLADVPPAIVSIILERTACHGNDAYSNIVLACDAVSANVTLPNEVCLRACSGCDGTCVLTSCNCTRVVAEQTAAESCRLYRNVPFQAFSLLFVSPRRTFTTIYRNESEELDLYLHAYECSASLYAAPSTARSIWTSPVSTPPSHLSTQMVAPLRNASGIQMARFVVSESIDEDVFTAMPNLVELVITGGVRSIPCYTFYPVTRIVGLSLYGNRLTALCPIVFLVLSNLRTLHLNQNLLTDVPPGLLVAQTSLLELDLAQNALTRSGPSWLIQCTSLTHLDLNGNQIHDLHGDSFMHQTMLRALDFADNVLAGCNVDLDAVPTVVCSSCATGITISPEFEMSGRQSFLCAPFTISEACRPALVELQAAVALQTEAGMYINETIRLPDVPCTKEELFENAAEGNAEAVAYLAEVINADLDAGDQPVDACANIRGGITITPKVAGIYQGALQARDLSGSTVTLITWFIHPTQRPVFGMVDGVRWATELQVAGRTVSDRIFGNTTSVAISRGESYQLPPLTLPKRQMFRNAYNDDPSLIRFQLQFSSSDGDGNAAGMIAGVLNASSPSLPSGSVLVDSSTGYIQARIATDGNFSVQLIASDGGGRFTSVWGWHFIVQPNDTTIPGYGPNGRGCVNGVPVDGIPYDRTFTCLCESTYTGNNCELIRPVASSESGDNDGGLWSGTSLYAMAVALGVAVISITVGTVLYHRERVKKRLAMQPVKFDDEHMDILLGTDILTTENAGERIRPREISRRCVTLLSELGSGQFGIVQRCLYKPDNNGSHSVAYEVAAKLLKPSAPVDMRESLLAEAVLMAQFDHPNVVGLVGVVTAGDPMLLLMQFCTKGSLLSVLRQEHSGNEDSSVANDDYTMPAPLSPKIAICAGVSKGMAYLANRHFVHRDLAARNVLIDAADTPLVADFGMSRELHDSTYYRTKSEGALPLRWTPPEVITSHKFSEASDVWAFGILLHEIFSFGETPYKGWMNAHIFDRVSAGYRMPRPDFCPQSIYDDIITPCLSADPQRRHTFAYITAYFTAYDCGKMTDNTAGVRSQQDYETDGTLQKMASDSAVLRSCSGSDKMPHYELSAGTAPAVESRFHWGSSLTHAGIEFDSKREVSIEAETAEMFESTSFNICDESAPLSESISDEVLHESEDPPASRDSGMTRILRGQTFFDQFSREAAETQGRDSSGYLIPVRTPAPCGHQNRSTSVAGQLNGSDQTFAADYLSRRTAESEI